MDTNQQRSEIKDALPVDTVADAFDAKDIGTQPLQFMIYRDDVYEVEAAVDGNDFVFHFYMPTTEEFWRAISTHNPQRTQEFVTKYWEEIFPVALDTVARDYFKAEFPRLTAMHMVQSDCQTEFGGKTRPLDSWWMKARGYVNNTLEPEVFVAKFYLALSQALRNRNLM